jgi:ferredoxin
MPDKYVVRFPAKLVEVPIATELVKDYGLTVSILRARVEPDEEGMMVVSLKGRGEDVAAALDHLRSTGCTVDALEKDIVWHEELCVECTACRSVCPTGALSTRPPGMKVTFDRDKCIACELCIRSCAYGALEITFGGERRDVAQATLLQ